MPTELKKHVAFIHCSNHLTLLQRKISNGLLYKAYNELMIKEEHTIRIGELIKLIGYGSNDYNLIKSSIKALISTVLEWNLLNDGALSEINGIGVNEKSWHASSILASAKIKGSVCTYSYSPELRRLLYMPEVYAKINLLVQAQFKSVYALVLYENCVRYKNLSSTRWFSIELFKKLMGISAEKYTVFRDMKRNVVDKAIFEINTFSELNISFEVRRINQKVVAIRFLIKPKNIIIPSIEKLDNSMTQPSIDEEVYFKLSHVFNISPSHAKNLINKYGYDLVCNKITEVESGLSKKRITNLSGYFIQCLCNEKQLSETKSFIKERNIKKESEDININKFKEMYEKYLRGKIIEKYFSIERKEQKLILREFEVFLNNSVFLGLYKNEGLDNILIQDELVKYIKQQHHCFFQEFLTFEDFYLQNNK